MTWLWLAVVGCGWQRPGFVGAAELRGGRAPAGPNSCGIIAEPCGHHWTKGAGTAGYGACIGGCYSTVPLPCSLQTL